MPMRTKPEFDDPSEAHGRLPFLGMSCIMAIGTSIMLVFRQIRKMDCIFRLSKTSSKFCPIADGNPPFPC